MGITPRFKQVDIKRDLDKVILIIEGQFVRTLKNVGEYFVKNAREAVTRTIYERQVFDKKGNPRSRESWELTGNLRSSIGYFVLKDGSIINHEIVGTTPKGAEEARRVIGNLPPKSGYKLVVVAGMDYASYVESKGFDVITTSADAAFIDLERLVRELEKRSKQRGYDPKFKFINQVI